MSPSQSLLARHLDRVLSTIESLWRGVAPSVPDRTPRVGIEAVAELCGAFLEGHAEARASGVVLPDMALLDRYALSELELAVVWLALAPHLEPRVVDALQRAADDVREDRLDVTRLLSLFAASRDEQLDLMRLLAADGRLVRAGLLEVQGRPLQPSRLRAWVDPGDHLAPMFAGARSLAPAARPFAEWVEPSLTTEALHVDAGLKGLVSRALTRWERTSQGSPTADSRGLDLPAGGLIVVEGEPGSGRATALKAIAGDAGTAVIVIEGRLLAQSPPDELRRCLASVTREADFFGELVILRDAAACVKPDAPAASWLAELLRQRHVIVAACVPPEQPIDVSLERVLLSRQKAPRPTHREARLSLWRANLEAAGVAAAADVAGFADRITLSPLQVRRASRLAGLLGDLTDGVRVSVNATVIEQAARTQIGRGFGRLATVSEPELKLEDLIVEDKISKELRAIISAVRDRPRVLGEWGLGRRIRRGTGIVALFDGDPGTGKTHAAEAIAGELGLSLVRIDISGVVDKYIGETEKHLTRIFTEARPDTSLLLFDEADSLFGKRTTEVEKSSDRYSNMDINVLLQLIERYPGIAILTTNLKKSIDKAFERRFSFKIGFTLPGPAERARIWQYLLPDDVTVSGPIDFERLASVELSGGEIKNAVMRAAYASAQHGELISTEALREAAEREAASAGRVVRRRAD